MAAFPYLLGFRIQGFGGFPRSTNTRQRHCTFDDYLDGAWERVPRESMYPGYQHCQIDLRQDCRAYRDENLGSSDYLAWKWVPRNRACALKRLAAQQMKTCLKDKTVIFVGDSLSRNQHQSIQCMLLEEKEPPQKFRNGYKSEYNSYYPETNTSVNLRVDTTLRPNRLTDLRASVIVVGTGPHWHPLKFGYNSSGQIPAGGWPCREAWVHAVGSDTRARNAIDMYVREIVETLELLPKTTRIIWRMPELAHFMQPVAAGKPWFKECAAYPETWQASSREILGSDPVIQWIYDSVYKHTQNTRIQIMDMLALSGARFDGHPSSQVRKPIANGSFAVHDCMHWCLPGVPDTWNEILVNYLCQQDTPPDTRQSLITRQAS